MNTATLRIVDANANRAAEGLRVVEEYARFITEDAPSARLCKELRHDLTEAMRQFPAAARLAARDTAGDIGTAISTPAEENRESAAEVALASLKRVQQALRCLEEYGKLLGREAGFESLRYRSYTLEKMMGLARRGRAAFDNVRLYVLADGGKNEEDFSNRIETILAAGAEAIQLRDKHLPDRQLLARAQCLRKLTKEKEVLFIMNDRPDLAALSFADGVHVGQEELTVRQARAIAGAEMLVGVSTHSLEQARQAASDGADYIGLGPTFPSTTKLFTEFPGLELLRRAAAEIALPAFAIGGISPENLDQVLACGIRRIAVSHAVWQAENPAEAMQQLRNRMALLET